MNLATQDIGASAAPRQSTGPVAPRWLSHWRGFALTAICLLAVTLYAWRIGSEGWGNPYYATTVKSMSKSLTNFVFGSFDPVGVVTVDKPPMAFWPMVLSVLVFGYHGWSVLLPQVVEGVAAVFLLHRTVRRWAGENVALLAALVLAITPVTVGINRNADPDTLMVLLMVAAGYAFTRSVDHQVKPAGATRWLVLTGVFLGFGFLSKMLQPWIVVPAFAVAYLLGSRASVGRRVRDLLVAGVALLASSAWWVALVSFWPGPRPYFGGSANGSVLDLVFGYNGLGRIFGQSAGQPMGKGVPVGAPVGGPAGGDFPGSEPMGDAQVGHVGFDGGSSITRMFNQEVGGQISWLLPLCLLVLIVVAVAGLLRMRANQPTDPARRAGWFLWGGWLLTTALVFSFMGGIFHPYYTTQLAPAVAALTAAGLAVMWRHYRRPGGYTWLLLPAAVVLTAVWAWVLVSRDTSWNGWLRYPVAAVAVLSVVLLVVGRLSRSRAALPMAGTVLGVVALLLAPGVWSAAMAFASGPGGGPGGQAGPPPKQSMNKDVNSGGSSGAVGLRPGPGAGPVKFFSGGASLGLSDDQRKILQYAQAHSPGARVTLAIEGGAAAAQSYIINTDAAVVGMGGFSGQDAAPTSDQLAQWVQQHQLRFVLAPSRHDDAGGGPQGNNGPGPNAVTTGPADPTASMQRVQWVRQHCAVVDPSAYGGSTEQKQDSGPFGNNVLYDCQTH